MVLKTIICECGEILHGDTFRDFIKTSSGPSTGTFGHKKCGYVFNFIDDKVHRLKSSGNLSDGKILATVFEKIVK